MNWPLCDNPNLAAANLPVGRLTGRGLAAGRSETKRQERPRVVRGQSKLGRRCCKHPGPWQFLPKKGTAMSLLVNRQPKTSPRPVHGVAKWLSPMGFLGTGVLAINGTPYTVLRLSS